MSLFHDTAKWSLRLLIVWGAVELAGALYDRGATYWTTLAQVNGHGAAAARLETRAHAAEADAARNEAELARLTGGALLVAPVAGETPPGAVARMVRDELIQLGAEAPVVDAAETGAVSGFGRLTITARWREPLETSPAALNGLTARFPELTVERLSLERGDRVTTAAVFSLNTTVRVGEEVRVAQQGVALQ